MKTYLAQLSQLPANVRHTVLGRTFAIFAATTAIAIVTAIQVHRNDLETANVAFKALSDKIVISIRETMNAYEQVLRGSVALFDAFGDVSRAQWGTYVKGLKLADNYPGIQGVGYAAVVTPANRDSILASARADGLANFKMYPAASGELNTTILYLEPMDWRNRRALGFDMFSEPSRRKAMQRARDTGEPAMTTGVKLLQETNQYVQHGVLLYLPVFAPGPTGPNANPTARTLKGFVYGPFRMNDLISRVLDQIDGYSLNLIRVELFDGIDAKPDDLLFDSMTAPNRTDAQNQPFHPRDGSYREQRSLDLHGAKWGLWLTSQPEFERQARSLMPWLITGTGILLGAIAATLFGAINLGKETAHLLADRLTAEGETRKRAQEDTRIALRELAHRVKNTLTIVTAIASQTVRHSKSLDEFDGKFRARLVGLSRVHDLLTSGRSYSTDFAALAAEVLKPYQGDSQASLNLDGPAAHLIPNTAIMLSMLFNELATNATKYGAWSIGTGRVDLRWRFTQSDEGQQLEINWRESGGPQVNQPTRNGFGSNVIKFAIERSLRGTADVEYAPDGVHYKIAFPWSESHDDQG